MKLPTQENIQELIKLARRDTWEDGLEDGEYVNPYEFSGGNSDDCYSGGIEVGQSWLAREVLGWLDIEWVEGEEG